jgi:tetratricopeptide (TPR) repeat protein
MAYYYIYNNDLKMAKLQLEMCILVEEDPPVMLFTTISEISDMVGETDDALKYATKALELDPKNEAALRIKMVLLIENQEYERSVEYLQRLLDQEPDNLQLLSYGAELYSELEYDNELIDVYTRILQIKPNLVNVRLNLGYLLSKKGLLSLAEKQYQQVLDLEPANKKALFYLTYIYLSDGRGEEANLYFRELDKKNLLSDDMLEDYASSLFIEGQDPTPVLKRIKDRSDILNITRAIIKFTERKLGESKIYFETAVKEDSSSIAGYTGLIRIAQIQENRDMESKWRFVLAGIYYNYNNFEKALEEALAVGELDPVLLENVYLLGDIYNNLGRKDEAIVEYEYFKKHSEEKGDVHIKLGLAYDEIGNHLEAVNNFREALNIYPDNDELYYYLGIEYRILDDNEKAVNAFKKAVELKQDNAYYIFHLGVSYERIGSIEEAIFYLDKSIQYDDNNAMALNYLGYLLADKGIRLDEAKEFIEKAVSMNPENGAYLDSLGWVYYKMSEYNNAKEYLEKAVKYIDSSENENYLVYDHLGDTCYKIGLMKEAIAAWNNALKMKFVEEIQDKIQKLEKELQD